MSRQLFLAAAPAGAALAITAAGCGSITSRASSRTPSPPPSLATSLVTADGTWAVDAPAARCSRLTGWRQAQVLNVPVRYGSSG